MRKITVSFDVELPDELNEDEQFSAINELMSRFSLHVGHRSILDNKLPKGVFQTYLSPKYVERNIDRSFHIEVLVHYLDWRYGRK